MSDLKTKMRDRVMAVFLVLLLTIGMIPTQLFSAAEDDMDTSTSATDDISSTTDTEDEDYYGTIVDVSDDDLDFLADGDKNYTIAIDEDSTLSLSGTYVYDEEGSIKEDEDGNSILSFSVSFTIAVPAMNPTSLYNNIKCKKDGMETTINKGSFDIDNNDEYIIVTKTDGEYRFTTECEAQADGKEYQYTRTFEYAFTSEDVKTELSKNNTKLTCTWEFDWDNDGNYDQTIEIIIDLEKVTLYKSSDSESEVEPVKIYPTVVKVNTDGNGSIEITDNNDSICYESEESGSFQMLAFTYTETSVYVTATANDGYTMGYVKVGGEAVDSNDDGIYTCALTGDTTIDVSFARLYTLTITCDDNGEVEVKNTENDGTSSGGTVEYSVVDGNTVTITAAPETGYHLLSFEVKDDSGESVGIEITDENGNKASSYEKDTAYQTELTVDSNYTVSIAFTENWYKIYTDASTYSCDGYSSITVGGTIIADSNDYKINAKYEDTPTVTITPADGYYIKSVLVNKTDCTSDVTWNDEDGSAEFLLSVTENKEISVIFEEIEDVSYLIEPTAEISYEDSNVYAYNEETTVTISVDDTFSSISYSGYDEAGDEVGEDSDGSSFTLNSTTKICEVKAYNETYHQWVTVVSVDNPLTIIIDSTAPEVSVGLNGENINNTDDTDYTDCGYYTSAYVVIKIENEYKLTSDKTALNVEINETEYTFEDTDNNHWAENENDTYTSTDDKYTMTLEETENEDGTYTYIYTISFANDGEYTIDNVSFTDLAGNTNEGYTNDDNIVKTSFTIDSTAPEVSVAFGDNTENKNGENYEEDNYYTSAYVVITVTEQNFDKTGLTVKINETEYTFATLGENSNCTVTCEDKKDGTYTYTISFSNDGEYTIDDVSFTDLAGNTNEGYTNDDNIVKTSFTIDSTAPDVSVDFSDNTENANGESYEEDNYYTFAEVKITVENENELTFDKTGLTVSIEEDGVKNLYTFNETYGEWKDNEDDTYTYVFNNEKYTVTLTENNGTYTYTISFQNSEGETSDGEYTINSVSFTDNAGNETTVDSDDKLPDKFILDSTAPTDIEITLDGSVWNNILATLTFGLWKNYEVTAEVTKYSDNLSGVDEIVYYRSNSTDTALTEEDLEELYQAWKAGSTDVEFSTDPYTVSDDEAFVIYARVSDRAGNAAYVSTEGVVYDDTDGEISFSYSGANENGIYNSDFDIEVTVNENADNVSAYSGIKSIRYTIENDGEITKEDTVFTFDNENPTYEELVSNYDFTIHVDSTRNNSCNVVVTVYVEDNAGNEYSYNETFDIDITAPTVKVSYEDTANEGTVDGYYTSRTATVTITECTEHFDADEATNGITITATDANKNKIVIETTEKSAEDGEDSYKLVAKDAEGNTVYEISGWTTSGSGDTATHEATIEYSADANYTFSISYTDMAGNQNDSVNVDKDRYPYSFTIDSTAPTDIEITLDGSVWNNILATLTFGLWKNYEVTAEVTKCSDNLSGVYEIVYYRSNSTDTALTEEDLEELYQAWKAGSTDVEFSTDPYTVSDDEAFVIYARVSDRAGNAAYVSTEGVVYDDTDGEISFSYSGANENGIYNSDFDIEVTVNENADNVSAYSGIKSIRYTIENDGKITKEDTVFTFDNENPTYEELVSNYDFTIHVDSTRNNSCNVVVTVYVEDNAGNEYSYNETFDIDITAPTVEVSYEDTANEGAVDGYYTSRTATVTITERTNHFNETTAAEGIEITAKDAGGNSIKSGYTISSWTTEGSGDSATHTVTITYSADANYTFSISYTDMAGNSSNSIEDSFTVDKTAPEGSVTAKSAEGGTKTSSILRTKLTFGFWSNTKISVAGTSTDATSPIQSVEYYAVQSSSGSDNTTPLTTTALNKVTSWKSCTSSSKYSSFSVLNITSNSQMTIYLKITDNAGNYTYICTDGLIVDKDAPIEEVIAPEITLTSEQSASGIYSDDVKISVTVTDSLTGGTYSGLKTVEYEVLNMGTVTQSGTLYSFSASSPSQSQLKQTYTGTITVDSELNNSNDVVIVVYAEDNSGNTSDKQISIEIDITAPTISVSYDNNSADSGSYYSATRTATIVVTERNFDSDDVVVSITNTDGVIPSLSSWTKTSGSGNGDNTTYTATITYSADGDYTFDISYTDLAGNKCSSTSYSGSNTKEFTIDRTAPTVSVSYDNNTAANGTYFNASRTATITVVEHNFDVSRVTLTQTASLDGTSITVPSASWTSSGNVHTATIVYSDDGDYTFDISVLDLAGNESGEISYGTSVAGESFTIDTTIDEPTIYGVSESEACTEEVAPTITLSDINFDYSDGSYTITLTRASYSDIDTVYETGKDSDEFAVMITNTSYGVEISFANFAEKKANDGLYTLTVTYTDKAGNEETETITFTVNRFGSVFVYDNYLISLISDGGQYEQSISKDLIIYEYNASKLDSDYDLSITRDTAAVTLDEATEREEITDSSAENKNVWYKYQYTISQEMFSADGQYSVSITSYDEAGNTSTTKNNASTDTIEDGTIEFYVDGTAPELESITGLEENIINAQEQEVKYSIYDTYGLKSVEIYINGVLTETLSDSEFSEGDSRSSGSFTIGESGSVQTVRIVATDMAGNVTDTDDMSEETLTFKRAVTISTNIFVRFYANKTLFWGSMIGFVVLAGVISFLIVLAKKKEKKEEK